MGVTADLGYTLPRPNVFQRSVQALASTRPGAWLFAKILARLDRVFDRLMHGRTSLPEVLAGLPVVLLATTGRHSHQRRETHLIAVPFADTLALLGTNFGQPHTPDWVLNLEDHPAATVSHHGATVPVRARPATALERAAVLDDSRGVYGGYVKYQQRITGRRLRIFVLEAA